jgi:DNA polymerase III delta prime subunit
VISVNYLRTDDYYDLHVPGHENYIAHGLCHHNTGTGKTLLAIALARYLRKAGICDYFLILVPNKINCDEWALQIEEHSPRTRFRILSGSSADKWEQLDGEHPLLTVCTYAGFIRMVCELKPGKGTRQKLKPNRKAVELLKEIGITLHASFMVDPDFSVQDFRDLETEIMKVCPAEVTFTVFSPSPGTDLWKQHKDDYIVDPYLYYDCMHTILPTKLDMNLFYAHFAKLSRVALQANPLRVNKVKVPFREMVKIIYLGTRYIFAMRNIYKDYLPQRAQRTQRDKV